MPQDTADKMLVVLLDDMIQHSLPRILAIKKSLQQGNVLSHNEIEFFIDILQRVNHCHGTYNNDAECRIIFSTIAHLIFKVLKQALKNEQALDPAVPINSQVDITAQPAM